MSKCVALFAGQGAQKTGMGQSLYENVPAAREIFERAEAVLPGISELCFHGEQGILNQTVNTQPAVFTVDMAAYAALSSLGVPISAAAGFSLGEYAALTAVGVVSFEDGLRMVVRRAQLMQQQAEKEPGSMAAILGIPAEKVEQIIEELNAPVLQAVNYNCPNQTVVAGDAQSMKLFEEYCAQNKIKRMPLPVNGAFHSTLMQGVAEQLRKEFSAIIFHHPTFPIYSNVIALPYPEDGEQMKPLLASQTARPVRWEATIRNMAKEGLDVFVELGPGSTLCGFLKRMELPHTAYSLGEYAQFLSAKEALSSFEWA